MPDSISISDQEKVELQKGTFSIVGECYKTAKTIPLVFRFPDKSYESTLSRLAKGQHQIHFVDKKVIYILDGFFSSLEETALRTFSETAGFSRSIYGSLEGKDKGEKPARSMNSQEKWLFFSNPPEPIPELYKLFSTFGNMVKAEITTLPWDLCDGTSSSPTLATNYLEEMVHESTTYGKHKDYDTEKGIAFSIPVLYSQEKESHPTQFINGEIGRPWLISVILYSTADNFSSEYGLGTAFYNNQDEEIFNSACIGMRAVFFEGDIMHSIASSSIPKGQSTYRISYVFKVIFNPRNSDDSIKEKFLSYINSME